MILEFLLRYAMLQSAVLFLSWIVATIIIEIFNDFTLRYSTLRYSVFVIT